MDFVTKTTLKNTINTKKNDSCAASLIEGEWLCFCFYPNATYIPENTQKTQIIKTLNPENIQHRKP